MIPQLVAADVRRLHRSAAPVSFNRSEPCHLGCYARKEKRPPDATLDDAICELEFRQAIKQGRAEVDRGERIPIEQVKSKIAEWVGK